MALLVFFDIYTICFFFVLFMTTYCIRCSGDHHPPGPRAWPLVGNMFEFITNSDTLPEVFMQYAKKYGNIFRIKFGSTFIVVVNGKDLIHEVLVKRSDVFSNRPDFSWMARQIGTDVGFWQIGIILSNGQIWKDLRRICLQAMRDSGMGKLLTEEKVQDEIRILVQLLSENENKPLLLHNHLATATNNIIFSIIFGSRSHVDDPRFERVLSLLNETLQISTVLQLPTAFPVLRYVPGIGKATMKTIAAFGELDEFISDCIKKSEINYNKNKKNFVNLFHDDRTCSSYTRKNLLRGVVDILLAGTETLATTLDWSLLFMMAYPDIQIKCQQEIDEFVGHGRNVKYEDRKQLIYTEATLCEAQRLASVVPLAVPHATLQNTTLGRYNIPKKATILVNLMSVHLDPDLWPEPETFQPERFIKDANLIKSDAYLPFSAGPRICLGESLARMELFLFFTNLLQRFTFKSPMGAKIYLKGYTGTTRSPSRYKIVAVRR